MESVNAYSAFLLDRMNKNKITENFLKPNKNIHFTSSKLYYYFDKDNLTYDKIKDTLNANFTLLKGDLVDDLENTDNLYEINDDGSFLINNDKEICNLSLDKLKTVYQNKYQEFENDKLEKAFVENLFSHFDSSFRSSLDSQNKEILRIYNEANKTDEKMDNLSYNEYKRSGLDYFDTPKKYLNNLNQNLVEQVDYVIKLKKYTDQLVLDNILLTSLKELQTVVQKRTNSIFDKIFSILQKNKNVIQYEQNSLKKVQDYYEYLNFAYFSKDYNGENFSLLQKILDEQYKGNASLINSLLNQYGYVNKQRALALCEDIGKFDSSYYSAHLKRRFKESWKDKLGFLLADVILKMRYKGLLKSDIETGNLQSLVKHLKEYDGYSLANYDYDSVLMLNLYALTGLLNQKIYDDYLSQHLI